MEREPERWVAIEEFPDYSVSTYGRVINNVTDQIKSASPNQQGIPSVGLSKDRVMYRRSVALLVAKAFLEPHPLPAYDTPINLDGDRTNNHVDNLMWRPRWFAVKYHHQLKEPRGWGWDAGAVYVEDTGERFTTIRDYATTYGVIERDALMGILNDKPVFPVFHSVHFSAS